MNIKIRYMRADSDDQYIYMRREFLICSGLIIFHGKLRLIYKDEAARPALLMIRVLQSFGRQFVNVN